MTPAEYVEEVVLPPVRAFLEAPNDRAKGYIAAILCFHIRDYLFRAGAGVTPSAIATRMCSPEFAIIDGICQGTKHCGRDRGAHRFTPGDEQPIPQFAFDTPGAGFGEGRWDSPGLRVEHDGTLFFVDDCVRAVLKSFKANYSQYLGHIDLSF